VDPARRSKKSCDEAIQIAHGETGANPTAECRMQAIENTKTKNALGIELSFASMRTRMATNNNGGTTIDGGILDHPSRLSFSSSQTFRTPSSLA
jgi:hypothetical protein